MNALPMIERCAHGQGADQSPDLSPEVVRLLVAPPGTRAPEDRAGDALPPSDTGYAEASA